MRKAYENVNSMIVAAFSCDLTRIVSIYVPEYNDLNPDYQSFHGWSHATDAGSVAESLKGGKWAAERVLDLISKLASTVEADGTRMLDNTLILWGNEQCAQVEAESHLGYDMPLMMAGGTNLGFVQGNYVDFRTRPFRYYASRGDFPSMGRPYNQLLASIMLGMGVPRSEFSLYGQRPGKFGGFGLGEYYNGEYDSYLTTYDDPIPFVFKG